MQSQCEAKKSRLRCCKLVFGKMTWVYTPFLLLSLLQLRDVLFSGKWIVGGNECNNTSIWTQVPRVGGADKILFSFLILLTYIVAIKMAKWHGHHDKYVEYRSDQRLLFTKKFILLQEPFQLKTAGTGESLTSLYVIGLSTNVLDPQTTLEILK